MQDLLILNKLKDVTQSAEELPYEMKVLFEIVRSMDLKKINISADVTEIKTGFEFKPTMGKPNIQLADQFKKQFSIWYKPVIYLPRFESAKPVTLDFIILKGIQSSLYTISESLRKELSTMASFSKLGLKDISTKMLSSLNDIELLLFVKKKVCTKLYTRCKADSSLSETKKSGSCF